MEETAISLCVLLEKGKHVMNLLYKELYVIQKVSPFAVLLNAIGWIFVLEFGQNLFL